MLRTDETDIIPLAGGFGKRGGAFAAEPVRFLVSAIVSRVYRMPKTALAIPEILKQLELFYGSQEPCWPVDPYLFLVWWHCGYPPSDAACSKGWDSLNGKIGTSPAQLLEATPAGLASALAPGGIVPELRAMRLKDIALRVQNEFSGDLRAALFGPLAKV